MQIRNINNTHSTNLSMYGSQYKEKVGKRTFVYRGEIADAKRDYDRRHNVENSQSKKSGRKSPYLAALLAAIGLGIAQPVNTPELDSKTKEFRNELEQQVKADINSHHAQVHARIKEIIDTNIHKTPEKTEFSTCKEWLEYLKETNPELIKKYKNHNQQTALLAPQEIEANPNKYSVEERDYVRYKNLEELSKEMKILQDRLKKNCGKSIFEIAAGHLINLPPQALFCILYMESRSGFKDPTRNIMQVMNNTDTEMNRLFNTKNPLSVNSDEENIILGVQAIEHYIAMFGDDFNLGISAYNSGPSLVKRINKIPTNAITQRYVRFTTAILEFTEKYPETIKDLLGEDISIIEKAKEEREETHNQYLKTHEEFQTLYPEAVSKISVRGKKFTEAIQNEYHAFLESQVKLLEQDGIPSEKVLLDYARKRGGIFLKEKDAIRRRMAGNDRTMINYMKFFKEHPQAALTLYMGDKEYYLNNLK